MPCLPAWQARGSCRGSSVHARQFPLSLLPAPFVYVTFVPPLKRSDAAGRDAEGGVIAHSLLEPCPARLCRGAGEAKVPTSRPYAMSSPRAATHQIPVFVVYRAAQWRLPPIQPLLPLPRHPHHHPQMSLLPGIVPPAVLTTCEANGKGNLGGVYDIGMHALPIPPRRRPTCPVPPHIGTIPTLPLATLRRPHVYPANGTADLSIACEVAPSLARQRAGWLRGSKTLLPLHDPNFLALVRAREPQGMLGRHNDTRYAAGLSQLPTALRSRSGRQRL